MNESGQTCALILTRSPSPFMYARFRVSYPKMMMEKQNANIKKTKTKTKHASLRWFGF